MCLAIMTINFSSVLVSLLTMCFQRFYQDEAIVVHFVNGFESVPQTYEAAGHDHRACNVVSSSLIQIRQWKFYVIDFFHKFSLVGRISQQAFQRRCFTKPSTLSYQIAFQYLSFTAPLDDSLNCLLILFNSTRQADFTLNWPFVVSLHISLSSTPK